MTTDIFPGREGEFIAGPANDAETVTVSSSDIALDYVSRAIRNPTTGVITVVVTTKAGNSYTCANIPAGGIVPIRATAILHSGTTDGDVDVLY